ncbi:MAG TPA: M4 family metallopeptidase [Holophagaceae bacterium]|nr:M4 family metallopeptidase [Holophagaceae bacterium]
MSARYRRVATSLALVLAGGALPGQGSRTLARPEQARLQTAAPHRAQAAVLRLLADRPDVGLDAKDLRLGKATVDARGRTLARFHQVYRGARVFGSSLVVAVDREGREELLGRAVEAGVRLEGGPRLSGAQAQAASHRNLMPQGAYEAQPKVELVVFPSRLTGGLQIRYDATKGPSWDREASVLARRSSATHVWAYEVVSALRDPQDGPREMHVIVDATTGDVLRKWDGVQTFREKRRVDRPKTYADLARASAPLRIGAGRTLAVPGRAAASVRPAGAEVTTTGVGHSWYNGDVALATSANVNGGFDLRDPNRASGNHPYWNVDNWFDTSLTGIVTGFSDGTYAQWAYYNNVPYSRDWQTGSADNVWGDGQAYLAPLPDADGYPTGDFHYADANGQTAAVDAHFAATTTYDMYLNILGRAGLDGLDSSVFSVVHYGYGYSNAFWDPYYQTMFYGDGTYPIYPDGDKSYTTLDVGGHEMSHGVMSSTANLDYIGESGALNEANSDMMSQAVVAYARRGGSDPADRIPAVQLPWTLGADINPAWGPFRFFYRPSLDGVSQDAWFYGLRMLDVHYGSGPANRMFYFLSQGAPSNPADVSYSPYLPAGMTGVGLDAATRIWFKAMTEGFTNTTGYQGARQACLDAAALLDPAYVPAVENAFAAINVGSAHGQAERPLVTFPENLVPDDSPLITANASGYIGDAFSRTPILPAGTVTPLRVNVANTANAAVTWKAGIGYGFFAPNADGDPLDVTGSNGSFDSDGLYHAPRNAPMWCGVRAFSQADPLEFGASMVFVAHMDADGDSDQDALDAGVLALTYGLSASVVHEISAYPDPEGIGSVDDLSLQIWGEGYKNAFGR